MGRILIVDPSIIDRQRIRMALEAAGHKVMEADSPDRALEQLKALPRGSVKLVVTELHFPEGDGDSLIRELKSTPGLTQIPVVVVAPQLPRERVIELVKAGASTIVTKPFSGELILRRVTEALTDVARILQGEGEVVSWTVHGYIRREVKRAERSRAPLTLLVVHLVSDVSEQQQALLMRSLSRNLRESDLVVRLGEGQVAVLLPDTDMEGGAVVEARIKAAAGQVAADQIGGVGLAIEVLVGKATYPLEAGDADTLVALARDRGNPLPQLMA